MFRIASVLSVVLLTNVLTSGTTDMSSGCASFESAPKLEDEASRLLWLGEWFVLGEESGYRFKQDGKVDYFFYKGGKRFSISDTGFFKVYLKTCEIKFREDLESGYHTAGWKFVNNVLTIEWGYDEKRVLIHLVKPDEVNNE